MVGDNGRTFLLIDDLPEAFAAADRLIARDRSGKIVDLPPTLGPTPDGELHSTDDLLSNQHNRDRPQMARAWVDALADPGRVYSATGWIRSSREEWLFRRFDYCDLSGDPRVGVVLVGVTSLRPDVVAPPQRPTATSHESARWSILRLSPFGLIQRAEGTLVDLYGRAADDLIGTNGLDLVHPDDHAVLLDAWADVVDRESPGRALRQRVVSTDGTATWVLASIGRPEPDGSITIHDLDITAQLAAEQALRASEERFRNLASELPVSVFVTDERGWFEFTNDTCRSLVGDSSSVDEFIGGSGSEWASILATARRDGDAEFTCSTNDGRLLRMRCQRPLADGTVCGIVEDVTSSTRWREAAAHDELTGLANRSTVTSEICRRIESGERSLVAFIDLDGFKRVNDEHGHDEGDRVLIEVASALRGMIRDGDVAGRWGGDEFVLLVDDLPPDAQQDLRRRVDASMIACGAGGASVGFTAVYAHQDVRALIDRADQAMYADKRRARR